MKTYARRHHTALFALALTMLFLVEPVGRIVGSERPRAQNPDDQAIIARVTIKTQAELEQLIGRGFDLLEMRDGDDLFMVTTPAEVKQLRAEGWLVEQDDEQTALLGTPGVNFRDGYRSVPEVLALLDERAALYPDLAEVFVYGSSWEKVNSGGEAGHDLVGIKLTNRLLPGPKPTFFLMAAIHSREIATTELALRLIDHLLGGYGVDGDATWLLDEHLIVIVPVVNPDGHRLAEQSYYQRKNTNRSYGGNCSNPPTPSNQYGVDLNRNYDFQWGTVNPPTTPRCSQTYPGPFSASEPETTAIQDLVRSLFPDQRGPLDTDPAPITATGILLTLHSYSNLVLWPWGHTSAGAPNGGELQLIGRKFAGYNGYRPQQSIQLYPTSGTTDDWAYGELGVASFTFEVGPSSGACGGFFPAFSCLDGGTGGSFWPRNLPTFLYAARIAGAPYQLVHGPTPETLTATVVTADSVELQAGLDEQRNGNQTIVAAEYYIDTPPWRGGKPYPMDALDGSFDSTVETATAIIGPLKGRHLIYVRAQDEGGNWGPVRAVFTPETFSR